MGEIRLGAPRFCLEPGCDFHAAMEWALRDHEQTTGHRIDWPQPSADWLRLRRELDWRA